MSMLVITEPFTVETPLIGSTDSTTLIEQELFYCAVFLFVFSFLNVVIYLFFLKNDNILKIVK